jgi:DNA-binding CsgD family transcriptional regulator
MLVENSNTHCLQVLKSGQLTFKELEIFSLTKKGMSCQEISEQLFISLETVKTHRKRIIRKLGLHGKQEFRKFIMNLLAEELMSKHENSPQNHP